MEKDDFILSLKNQMFSKCLMFILQDLTPNQLQDGKFDRLSP